MRSFRGGNLIWIQWAGVLGFICAFGPQLSFADDFRFLYQGARAMAMGNALTAIAEDEEAIFYNPAALAGVHKFELNLLNSNAQVSNDAISLYPTFNRSLEDPGFSSLNNFIGKNAFARVQGTSSFVVPGMGVAALFDQQVAIRLRNQSFPVGVIGAQTTYGGQVGMGFSLVRLKHHRGELRFGVAGKFLYRGGGYQTTQLTDLITLNSGSIMDQVNGPRGSGVGADLGLQFIGRFKRRRVSLLAGLAFKDIGRTSFSGGASPQMSNLTLGVASQFNTSDFVITVAYDYSNVFDLMDWKKKTHFGVEFKFAILTLSAGLNQLSLTYGASINLWLIDFGYTSYAEELATVAGQDSERRHFVHLGVKMNI